jgi:hypothetical protein
MKKTILHDGTAIYCLRKPEAKMLDHHVDGYLQNGITIKDGDVVFDVGANPTAPAPPPPAAAFCPVSCPPSKP